MAVGWITPVDVTPATGADGTYTDYDASSDIPVGATGVIVHIVDASGSLHALRKNGSTDNFYNSIRSGGHIWRAIGVDGDRIFERKLADATIVTLWLVGYFTDDAVFFTNAVTKNPGSTNTWVDLDISGDTSPDTSIGAIFHIVTEGFDKVGLRNNASTDAREAVARQYWDAIIGVDGSEICEGFRQDTTPTFHLVGYITKEATFNVNALDRSITALNTWTDLTALPTDATGGIYEVKTSNVTWNWGLRLNGSTENIIDSAGELKSYGLVEADGSLLVEGQISNTGADFYEQGYFEPDAGDVLQGAASLTGSATVAPGGGLIFPGLSSLTGTASVALAAGLVFPGAAALAGSGSVSSIGRIISFGLAPLTGVASVSPLGQTLLLGLASITGVATVAPAAGAIFPGLTSLSGVATLAPAAGLIFPGLASVVGVATISPTGSTGSILLGVAALSGVATLAPAAGLIFTGLSSLTGVATISPTAILLAGGSIALTGIATISPTGSIGSLLFGLASLSGVATLAPAAGLIFPGLASLSGVATLAPAAGLIFPGLASLSGVAIVTPTAVAIFSGAASVVGTAAISPTGSIGSLLFGLASLSGVATLAPAAGVVFSGLAALAGVGSITPTAILLAAGSTALTGVGSVAPSDALRVRLFQSIMPGVASLQALGTAIFARGAVLSAQGSVSPTGSFAAGGASPLVGTATVIAQPLLCVPAFAVIGGVGTIIAAPGGIQSGSVILLGTANIRAKGTPIFAGVSGFSSKFLVTIGKFMGK